MKAAELRELVREETGAAVVAIAECGCLKAAYSCTSVPGPGQEADARRTRERYVRRDLRAGLRAERWLSERVRAAEWVCPEHLALSERLAREKEAGR